MKSLRILRFSFLLCLFFGVAMISACRAEAIKNFTSDGCSLFPDGNPIEKQSWCSCCLDHDITYWQGGTSEQRINADLALKSCVLKKTQDISLANMMYDGVRFGGAPIFPNWYRWGYGWPYGRGYQKLNRKEQQLVKQKLELFYSQKAGNICSENE